MKIIEPEAFIYQGLNGVDRLRKIEEMARISHRSEDKQTEDSWRRFITAVVIDHGDWSVVEHESVTVIFRVDRGITHELVRHRLFSFTQESTRFVRNAGDIEFICPSQLIENDVQYAEWKGAVRSAEQSYHMLLEQGARPQEARAVLPNALAATIAVTGNLRNWRHFFLMRTSKETHPDFRRVTIPLLKQFKKEIPILYDDIEPNARQIDNLRKPR
jgi:thymidylate synthase (FAD)